MSSGIDTVKGLPNITAGHLKQIAAEIAGSATLLRRATCQQEKGRAQLVWAREGRTRAKALRTGT